MPKGTVYRENGSLVVQGSALFLRLHDGGHWRLDSVPGRTWKWVGRRVDIVGTRDSFDLLAVSEIEL